MQGNQDKDEVQENTKKKNTGGARFSAPVHTRPGDHSASYIVG